MAISASADRSEQTRSLFRGSMAVPDPIVRSLLVAYIGPGAGISVIGTVVAFLGAVVFAIVGFVWYPIKRLLAFLRGRREQEDQTPAST